MSAAIAACEPPAPLPVVSDAAAPDAAAMIDALKRKLVATATELQSANDKLATVSGELEVEKREHQLTTTKLSSLLRKRSAQPQQPAHELAHALWAETRT